MNHLVCVLLLLGLSSALANSITGRIVGGEDADIRQYPHQISMRYNGRHRCGGSIFTSNIIISAAHCVVGLANASNLTIAAGSTRNSRIHQILPVREFIVHENYKEVSNDNDVTILVLNGDFVFNEFVQPIQLATERPEVGATVTVTGWGTLVQNGTSPDVLQQVDVNVVSKAQCKKAYFFLLTDRMICAAVEGGGKDACQGDSGGPLVYNNQLLGIVSWGWGCAKSKAPGIYASVPDLRDWILKTSAANSDVGRIQFL